MKTLDTALVVDDSVVATQLLRLLLRLHAKHVDTAPSVAEARRWMETETADLIVIDATLDGSVAWIEECAARDPRPAFVVVTSRPAREEETKTTLLGAIGYLAKPFTYRQLASTLASASRFFEATPPRFRAPPLARAAVRDPASGEEQISCEVRDLSPEGAFLVTAAPIPTGTALDLRLYLGDRPVSVAARVQRIQEPRWGVTPGCGVVLDHSDESRQAVAGFLKELSSSADDF